MLKQMREGAKSTVLKLFLFGLLLLAMSGLALMDVQGIFRSGVSNDTISSFGRVKGHGILAWILDSVPSNISAQSFDRIVQSALRQQRMKQSDAYRGGLPRQVLKQELDSRMFAMEAADAGLQVDDVLAAAQVKEMIAPLVEQGMTKEEALGRMEQLENTNEGGLVGMVKTQIATDQLIKIIGSGVFAPQQMVSDALKFRDEYRRGEYFRLTAENAGTLKPPTDAELKSYYDTIASEYALPEYRTLSVIVLDKKALGDAVKISEDRLKQYYDQNIADYKTPENRVIAQVVAPDEATAKLIYAAALKSKDLQAASKDKGSYLKPATFSLADISPALSKAAFSGKAGEILPPVQSSLGWHIIYIEKVIPGVAKPFDSVKADIEKDLSQDKVAEALYQRANKIDDEIGGGKSLSEVAKENNIAETVLEKIDAHGVGANGEKENGGKKENGTLPLFDKLVATGFTLKKGAASPLIETPDGAFAIVGARDIFPSEQQSFDKLRANILTRWTMDHQLKALGEEAAKIMDRLKQGESLSTIAAQFKQPVQTTAMIQRGANPLKEKLESNLIAALFSLDKPGQATTVTSDNSVTIIRLADRKIQIPAETAKKDNDEMTAVLDRALKQDLLEQFRTSLIAKYDVQINDKLLSSKYTSKDDNASDTEE